MGNRRTFDSLIFIRPQKKNARESFLCVVLITQNLAYRRLLAALASSSSQGHPLLEGEAEPHDEALQA